MRWADERYIRVYTRDTAEWVALGWEAQALFVLALRKMDRAGILELGRAGTRGLAALVGMPIEVVDRALPVLLEDGCLVLSGTTLVAPNYIEAQESKQSDAQRQRESRARARDLAAVRGHTVSRNVTPPDATQEVDEEHLMSQSRNVTSGDAGPGPPSHGVTGRHTASHEVTPSLAVPSRAVPSTLASARARETRLDPGVGGPGWPPPPPSDPTPGAQVAEPTRLPPRPAAPEPVDEPAPRPRAPLIIDATEMGPLGAELRARLEQGMGRGLVVAARGEEREVADEVEGLVEQVGGVDAAFEFVRQTIASRRDYPGSMTWVATVLRPIAKRAAGGAP